MSTLLNAALLFEDNSAHQFQIYSALLAKQTAFDLKLGPKNLPHLTVLQFEGEGDVASWRRLAGLAMNPIPLTLAGLTFVPAKEGYIWVEIQVLKSEALEACQRSLLGAIGGRPTHNGLGDGFRPHITLGRIAHSRKISGLPVNGDIVRMKNVTGRLSVGFAGPNYEFLGHV
jgi:2'-5' RNA ligase